MGAGYYIPCKVCTVYTRHHIARRMARDGISECIDAIVAAGDYITGYMQRMNTGDYVARRMAGRQGGRSADPDDPRSDQRQWDHPEYPFVFHDMRFCAYSIRFSAIGSLTL